MPTTSALTGRTDNSSLTDASGVTYNAVFTDKTDNSILEATDFMNLLITQMQNQDFTNPMDNTQMVNQMATFANMEAMQNMAEYAKTSYAMTLVGKSVTASRYSGSGIETTSGVVTKVSFAADENDYIVYVNGKKYKLAQIMEVGTTDGSATDDGVDNDGNTTGSQVDPSNYDITATVDGTTAKLSWAAPTEDDLIAAGLKYTVYYMPYDENNKFNTVQQVEAGTKLGSGNQTTTTGTLENLEPNTSYTINVVVTDANGVKTVYPATQIKTGKAE